MSAVVLRLILVFSPLLLAACAADEPGDAYDAEPFASTVILDEGGLAALRASEADGTLRFSGTPPQLAGIAPGQVVVAGASPVEPRGLLRFVGAVEQDGQDLVLRTTEAPLQLAFRKLEVRFQRRVGQQDQPLALEPIASREMALKKTISGDYWPELEIDDYAFNGDGDPETPLDQVHVTGKLTGGMRYSFTLSVDWDAVNALPSAVVECAKKLFKGSLSCSLQSLMPEARVGFDLEAGATAELGLEGVAFLGYEREIPLGQAELPQVPVGPLVFFPEVQILARVSGEASSQFRLSTRAAVGAKTSISYSSKSGGSFTPPVLSKSFEAPVVEASLAARSGVAIGPRLVVTVQDIAGVYASLYAVAEVTADQAATPCWHLRGGVDGDAGFLIKSPDLPLLGSVTLAKFGKTFGLADEEIASGSCNIPGQVGPGPTGGAPELAAFTSPDFTPWSAVYPDLVDGHPHEGLGAQVEWAQVTPTIDGRFTLAGSDTRALLKLDPDGEVVWARRFEATDVSFFHDTLTPDLLPGRVVSAADGTLFVVAHPFAVLKVDASGELWWARRFDVPYMETWLRFTDAVADGAGGLFVAGTAADDDSSLPQAADGWLLRLDKSGAVSWSVRFGAAGQGEVPRRLVRQPDGVAVVGQLWDASSSRWRGLAARFSDDGTLSWGRQIVADDCGGGNEQWIYPTAALRSRDGDLILGAGVMHSGYQIAVMKLKPDGSLAWSALSGASEASHLGPMLTDLVELPTSGYLAAGNYSGQATHQDIWLAGLDAVGQVQWARSYGGSQNPTDPLLTDDSYPALLLTRDGGVVVAAFSEALSGEHSLWAMKVPAKDGTISFDPTTSAATATLGLGPASDTCLAASGWSPPVASHAASPAALPLKVHAVPATAQPLAP